MKKIVVLILMVLSVVTVKAQSQPSASERADLQVEKISKNMSLTSTEKQMLKTECLQFQKDSDALAKKENKMKESEYKKELTAIRNDFYTSVRNKLSGDDKIESWEDMNKNRSVHK